jgi:hypothetical protein
MGSAVEMDGGRFRGRGRCEDGVTLSRTGDMLVAG